MQIPLSIKPKLNQRILTPPLPMPTQPYGHPPFPLNPLHIPHRHLYARHAREIRQPHILHIPDLHISIRHAVRKFALADGPACVRRRGRHDEEAGVCAEEVREVLHECVAEALGEQEVGGWGLPREGHEDAVRARQSVHGHAVAGCAFGHDGHGVGHLALVEQWDGDVDEGVVELGDEVLESGVACFLDWGIGAVEPGFIDAEDFVARSGEGARRTEVRGGIVRGVGLGEDAVGNFEVGHVAC